jgi:hypothetical protein
MNTSGLYSLERLRLLRSTHGSYTLYIQGFRWDWFCSCSHVPYTLCPSFSCLPAIYIVSMSVPLCLLFSSAYCVPCRSGITICSAVLYIYICLTTSCYVHVTFGWNLIVFLLPSVGIYYIPLYLYMLNWPSPVYVCTCHVLSDVLPLYGCLLLFLPGGGVQPCPCICFISLCLHSAVISWCSTTWNFVWALWSPLRWCAEAVYHAYTYATNLLHSYCVGGWEYFAVLCLLEEEPAALPAWHLFSCMLPADKYHALLSVFFLWTLYIIPSAAGTFVSVGILACLPAFSLLLYRFLPCLY